MTEIRLNEKGENAWQRLKSHLELSEGFMLGFILSDSSPVVDIYRQRLSAIYRTRITQLQTPDMQVPDDLVRQLLPRIIQDSHYQQALGTPTWVDLSDLSGKAWHEALYAFLLRLNEQREQMRRNLSQPMILILPLGQKHQIRAAMPDLWSIRHFTLDVDASLVEETLQAQMQKDRIQPSQAELGMVLDDYDEKLLQAWQRIVVQQEHRDRAFLLLAERVFTILIKSRRFVEANQVANSMLEYAREQMQVAEPKPEALRDVSVSLDNVGDSARAQGQHAEAAKAFQESLHIRRQLLQRLGETPEALRDVCVSLYRCGEVAQELAELEQARALFEEGLMISQGLATALPDLTDYNDLPDYFTEKLYSLHPTDS